MNLRVRTPSEWIFSKPSKIETGNHQNGVEEFYRAGPSFDRRALFSSNLFFSVAT
jgi:hypothetical protein